MLTKKQKEIFDFVKSYSKKRGYSPSIPEISKGLKRAVGTIHEHLRKLEEGGFVRLNKNQRRGIEILDSAPMVKIPLLGTIAAGSPITLFDVPSETIAVPKNKIPPSSEIYALRVIGNSMIEENINDGDIVLVRHQETAENGQKVVALIDNYEATLKKFYKERGQIRLQPANKNFEPIIIRNNDRKIEIKGIVLDVIKSDYFSTTDTIEAPIKKSQERKKPSKPEWIIKGCEFYLGDNLQILQQLERKYATIYLDPPFNSNRNYKYAADDSDHIFKDTWEDGQYEQWLDRLIYLCKEKLNKNGSLFFHISAELSFIPQKVLSKHFKKVEPIFWKKAHGKNTVKNKLGSVVDIIYKASDNGSKFNVLYVPLDQYYFENSYKNKDEVGFYALGSIKHDKTRRGHFYKIERNGIVYEAPYGWKISKNQLEKLMKLNRIHFAKPKNGDNKAMLYKKLYKHECKGKPLSNLWDDISYITRTTKDERLYPTQKPLELLKRLVQLSSGEGDWILDPVAGSGTTGVAASLLNRKSTLIDINPMAEKISHGRLRKVSV